MTVPGTCSGQPLPAGWRWVKLGEVTTVVNGTTPESENPSFWSGDIVWITPTDLGKLPEPYIRNSDRKITKAGFDSRNLTRVPPRSVVLSSRAPIGHLGIAALELCTNQGCKSFIPSDDVDEWFLYYALKRSVWKLQQLGSGATFAEISKTQLESFSIPLPALAEQRRIAGVLREQMAAVEKARAAAQARLEAVKTLPTSLLRQVFPEPGQLLPDGWRWVKLGDKAKLLPSRSIASDGDIQVQAVTTACLTESGFNPGGVKSARMRVSDVRDCTIATGEVLIARSNTPELVGRACLFDGIPDNVVASDLTIRIQVTSDLLPYFLSRYLSALFVRGYWREQAGGASGTMKKITRTQVLNLAVPLPPLFDQRRIAEVLNEQMMAVEKTRVAAEEELETINALPSALLGRAFNGEV
jgi:type I restriction enzyme S subunit